MILLKLSKIGNSVGVVLPREALAHLKAQEGDTICVTRASDGSLRMSSTSPEVTPQLEAEAAQDLVRRYRHETEAVIHGLAAGETREADYAAWMQARSRPA